MKICVAGGGPGGLYFAICVKRKLPHAEVTLFERNAPNVTYGWGVVFSGRTQETLALVDEASAERMADEFVHWDTIETILETDSLSTSGYPFYGIDRRKLLNILTDRCLELGVEIHHDQELAPDDPAIRFYDLVVAADGVNSRFRSHLAEELGAREKFGSNKYIWLGTKAVFDRFRFVFKQSGSEWLWAHAYPFDRSTSTFIVECSKSAWERCGYRDFDSGPGCRRLASLFEDILEGQELLFNGVRMRGSHWDQFRQVECARWNSGNIVLIGDAAHTIHFSVGSGTKQAFDDAICLANAVSSNDDLQGALRYYQRRRQQELATLKAKGSCSMRWFEDAAGYADNLGVGDFERALLNRATNSDYEDEAVAAGR
ncbi:MAG: FAD-dependent monooxygenase [Gammaproteobacteria bacterium]|nr:FAD-dependent monooxygenase [Gammaproteobacteria bacterium]